MKKATKKKPASAAQKAVLPPRSKKAAKKLQARPAEPTAAVLDRLYETVMSRRTADTALSHSARLLSRGRDKVAQKFGEEAVECLIEAVAGNATALVAESADVLYHLLVMWVATGVAPEQVWAELVRRESISGVAEKAARAKPAPGMRKIP